MGDGIPIPRSMSTMMTMVRNTAKSLTVDRTWGEKPGLRGARTRDGKPGDTHNVWTG